MLPDISTEFSGNEETSKPEDDDINDLAAASKVSANNTKICNSCHAKGTC